MPDRTGTALRALAGLSALMLAGLALAPERASAGEDPFGVQDPHRARPHRDARRSAPPPPPRAAIVSGYLPRNHGVPMYNEPPRREARW